MIRIRKGTIDKIIARGRKITVVSAAYDGIIEKAVNYNFLTGCIEPGDIVYLNTSANYLGLGTGGYSFIIINETRGSTLDIDGPGHMMKMRYTPCQIKCSYPGEEDDGYQNLMRNFKDLDGMVVILGELHSMLAPAACCLKYLNSGIKIAYIMTDGGSLPIDISFSVNDLKSKNIITAAITSGNAFGGDMESVNIYDALVMAKEIAKCDMAIITMGPGIVGTETKYGFSGIEQGSIIDAVNTLKGVPVVIPRISFNDKRPRHYGISHHTLTVLSEISKTKAHIIFPVLDIDKDYYIKSQISKFQIDEKHYVKFIECNMVKDAVKYYNINCSTMNRDLNDDYEFFLTCGCAAYHANSVFTSI